MRILAIDTATEACSAALLVEGRVISREREFERGHAEHILPMVDEVLAEGGVTLAMLDALAFGRGPGGFTGVRLATSVVQGLAFAADRPVVPISDLAAVAQRVIELEPSTTRVLVCNDARMQEVYWGCFERGADGVVHLVGAEHVSPPTKVALPAGWLEATTEPGSGKGGTGSTDATSIPAREATELERATRLGPLHISGVGRGFRVYPALATALAPHVQVTSDTFLPRSVEIVRLAVPEVEAGRVVPAEQAIPVYLRDDVARPQPVRGAPQS